MTSIYLEGHLTIFRQQRHVKNQATQQLLKHRWSQVPVKMTSKNLYPLYYLLHGTNKLYYMQKISLSIEL